MSLADPVGSSVFLATVRWIEGTLLGTIATSVAIIAVAGVGIMIMTGNLSWKRGATVIAGCFILFGAPTIARGIMGFAQGGGSPSRVAETDQAVIPENLNSSSNDPYAGAAVPVR